MGRATITIASEPQRRCGYRKVGGLYLVSDPGSSAPCDRLPMPIVPCPCCGEQPRFHRSIAMIDPFVLWGNHLDLATGRRCCETDAMCAPADRGFLMWVGNEYTVENFRQEADRLGVSKRIPAIPKTWQWGSIGLPRQAANHPRVRPNVAAGAGAGKGRIWPRSL